MTAIGKKLVVAGVLMVGAIGYLATAGVSGGWVYYVGVDQISAEHEAGKQRVRVHGRVGEENFVLRAGTLSAQFELKGENRTLPVDYRGPIPDLFKAGCDAVVEGRFDASAGVLRADVLMTKCASKYDEATPHAKGADAS